MHRSLYRFLAVGTLALIGATTGATMAHAGIFHRKQKPLKTADDALASVNSQQPDKALFDRAMLALKKGKYDVARLDLQTLLNTYPDSEYQMRAKLAIGDTWFKEGGSAAMEQAESEYKDFITFFPNQPEAAEAQMKVADIYYKQMEKPDRDPTKALRAQEEYRQMILQFPDSTLIPQAKQRLREVQEVLADHEFNVGTYYLSRNDYPAAVARLQSLVDSYPLYSQVDQALIGVGDAYAAESHSVQQLRMDPAAKERLGTLYTDRAAQAYDRVILEYPMMPHADDARDRLEALNQPIPEPSKQQVAESEAQEQSRAQVNLKYRAILLITSRPSTLQASRIGEPTLTDPAPILAPQVVKETISDVAWSMHPDGKPAPTMAVSSNQMPAANAATNAASNGATEATPGTSAPASGGDSLQLQAVPTAGNGDSPAADTSSTQTVTAPTVEGTPAPQSGGPVTGIQATAGGARASWPNAAPQSNGGLPTAAPKDNTPLPAAQAPAEAPNQINDVTHPGPAVNTANENTTAKGKKKKKNPKPKYNSGDESSSTHKKKKGLDKLNPF
ncbi:MAG TPA: outer membrane protein assembly factor BamD [Acidobacteriaceae bacterium]|jgi:outer membrane protein assembly factor BamD|nr:outer membrane protein assembly factor BamD [Acidobacteriaceae bacterium]